VLLAASAKFATVPISRNWTENIAKFSEIKENFMKYLVIEIYGMSKVKNEVNCQNAW
jgi:hypothetical protein